MLICVKEKKPQGAQQWDGVEQASQRKGKCTLKGSILIKKHLKRIETNNGKPWRLQGNLNSSANQMLFMQMSLFSL